MNRIIIILVIVSVSIIIMTTGVMTFHYVTYTLPELEKRTTCESKGGNFVGYWSRIDDYCVIPPSDEGKACTDSSQCEKLCVAESQESTTGVCMGHYDAGSNYWEMENGLTDEKNLQY